MYMCVSVRMSECVCVMVRVCVSMCVRVCVCACNASHVGHHMLLPLFPVLAALAVLRKTSNCVHIF